MLEDIGIAYANWWRRHICDWTRVDEPSRLDRLDGMNVRYT